MNPSEAGLAEQPISRVQWVPAESLSENGYNPNVQAPPEHRLLKLSMLADGWTMPIVVRGDQIVDGYHKWKLATTDAEVAAMTGGWVPIVDLGKALTEAHARASTIRHNRARGVHAVLRMADIVADMHADGLSHTDIQRELGMDREEVIRLLDRGDMLNRGRGDVPLGEFSKGWHP